MWILLPVLIGVDGFLDARRVIREQAAEAAGDVAPGFALIGAARQQGGFFRLQGSIGGQRLRMGEQQDQRLAGVFTGGEQIGDEQVVLRLAENAVLFAQAMGCLLYTSC